MTALIWGCNTEQGWQGMDEIQDCIQVSGMSMRTLVHIHHQHPRLYRILEARYMSHNRCKGSWLHHSSIQVAIRALRALA